MNLNHLLFRGCDVYASGIANTHAVVPILFPIAISKVFSKIVKYLQNKYHYFVEAELIKVLTKY